MFRGENSGEDKEEDKITIQTRGPGFSPEVFSRKDLVTFTTSKSSDSKAEASSDSQQFCRDLCIKAKYSDKSYAVVLEALAHLLSVNLIWSIHDDTKSGAMQLTGPENVSLHGLLSAAQTKDILTCKIQL